MSSFSFGRALSRASVTVLALTCAFVSCTSLPDIASGVCGNHVLDGQEDCDEAAGGAATPTTRVCRLPGTVGQCRLDCSHGAGQCPSGMACGRDSICRAPKGEFAALSQTLAADSFDAQIADFDGDGLNDILARGLDGVTVFYADSAGTFSKSFEAPVGFINRPAIGQFTVGDSLADVAIPARGGVAIWKGQSNQTLVPTAYPSFPVDFDLRMLVGDVLPATAGDELVMFLDLPKQSGSPIPAGPTLAPLDASGQLDIANVLLTSVSACGGEACLKGGPSATSGTIQQARFAEALPCTQFAMAFDGSALVRVISPCRADGTYNTIGPKNVPPVLVELPDSARKGIIVGDLNGDGHVDIVADVNEAIAACVAYGVGDGTFQGTLPLPASNGDNKCVKDAALLPAFPLAIGQITKGDTVGDLVFPTGIVLRTAARPPTTDGGVGVPDPTATTVLGVASDNAYVEAHVLDVNGDGALDVVAGLTGGIDVYIGRGDALMTLHEYRTKNGGDVSSFVFKDLDGDGALDIAYKDATRVGVTPVADSVGVLFGRLLSAPLDPRDLGSFGTVVEVESGVVSGGLGNSDGIADLGVLGLDAQKNRFIAILDGASSRFLLSPYQLALVSATPDPSRDPTFAYSFVSGQFTTGDTHADLSSIASEVHEDVTNGDTETMRLWRVPSSGAASLGTPGAVTASDVLDTIAFTRQASGPPQIKPGSIAGDWRTALLATVDLDPGTTPALDEVVTLLPPAFVLRGKTDLIGTGEIRVSKLTNDTWTKGQRIQLDATLSDSGAELLWHLDVADIDGDGKKDVIVIYDHKDGRRLEVYLNKGDGSLDTNAILLELPPEEKDLPVAFAAVNADLDPARELVVSTLKGSGLYKLDTKARKLDLVRPLAIPKGAASLAGGDLDGDGIDDVAFVDLQTLSLQVFRGLSVLP